MGHCASIQNSQAPTYMVTAMSHEDASFVRESRVEPIGVSHDPLPSPVDCCDSPCIQEEFVKSPRCDEISSGSHDDMPSLVSPERGVKKPVQRVRWDAASPPGMHWRPNEMPLEKLRPLPLQPFSPFAPNIDPEKYERPGISAVKIDRPCNNLVAMREERERAAGIVPAKREYHTEARSDVSNNVYVPQSLPIYATTQPAEHATWRKPKSKATQEECDFNVNSINTERLPQELLGSEDEQYISDAIPAGMPPIKAQLNASASQSLPAWKRSCTVKPQLATYRASPSPSRPTTASDSDSGNPKPLCHDDLSHTTHRPPPPIPSFPAEFREFARACPVVM